MKQPVEVKRATVDDLPELRRLWLSAGINSIEVEKRFTEFQVAREIDGKMVAAIGLHLAQQHGLIHTEAFSPLGETAEWRAALWNRVQNVAKNNGLFRLWTRLQDPFYREKGFGPPDEAAQKKMPAVFAPAAVPGELLTLKLKDELSIVLSPEQEFTLFQEAQKESAEKLMEQARTIRSVAYALLALFCGALLIGAFVVFKKLPRLRRK